MSTMAAERDEAAVGEGPEPLARAGGVAGLLFAAGVVLQNGILLSGNPLPDASVADIVDFYTAGESRIGLGVGLVAVNMVCLLLFTASVADRISAVPQARIAARAGFGAAVLLGGAFLSTTALQAVLTARVSELERAGLLPTVWDLHSAAFTMSATGLAGVLGFFAVGSLLGGDVVPRWVSVLGLAGAVALVVAGLLVTPSLDGGAGVFCQLAGFATWLVFLVVASIRLLRR